MTPDNAIRNDALQHGHEPDKINARAMIVAGTGLVLLVALVLLLMFGTLRLLSGARELSEEQPTVAPTAPRVTADQPQQLRELRASEQRRLSNYEWIDQADGVARIPIARAMEILAESGLQTIEQESEGQDADRSQ